jgi:hypothetical protein
MLRASRVIFVAGLVLLLIPCVAVGLLEERDWVADGIYGAAIYAGVVLAFVWGLGELVFHFLSDNTVGVVVLCSAIALVAVPSVYINGAAFVGRSTADFSTWHLLPLFTVLHQLGATVVVTLVAALVALVYRAIAKNAAA